MMPVERDVGAPLESSLKEKRIGRNQMARHVFFSFHYADIWRVNVIRNSYVVEGTAVAGFRDGSLWEEAKKKGDAAIKKMIDDALEGTSVTCVLIGEKTCQREYVTYEIEKSIERGNGIFGVRIHTIKDQNQKMCMWGNAPQALINASVPVYDWDKDKFGDWVEQAYKAREQTLAKKSLLRPAAATATAGLSFPDRPIIPNKPAGFGGR
jgi:Thoeris protein ThsB, TIR-like domain